MLKTPKILSGPGALAQLKDLLQGPLVLVSDAGLAAAGVVKKVAGVLQPEECLHFLRGEPTAAEVDHCAQVLRSRKPTVVGLGGGSALDLAKLAASVAGDQAPAEAYANCARPLPESLPTVLIATTAGTGSEMTRTAVFQDANGHKTWAWGEQLQAEIAVLDPELTLGLPSSTTVMTAVDALSHALEAATAVNHDPLAANLAQQAVAMIPPALARVVNDPADLKAREELLNASGLAGIALNSCGTGLAHALAHALGGLVKVPHGLAIAWALRVTLAWNPADCYHSFPWLRSDPAGVLNGWLDGLSLPSLQDFDPERLAAAMEFPENRVILDNNARPVRSEDVQELARQFHRLAVSRSTA